MSAAPGLGMTAFGMWVVAGGLAWLAASVALASPTWGLTALVFAGAAATIGAYLGFLVLWLTLTGRFGMPAYYNYDHTALDIVGSTLMTLAVGAAAASIGLHWGWLPGAMSGLSMVVLFGFVTANGMRKGLAARRILPSPRDFWPCEALLGHTPNRPLADPTTEDTIAGHAYGWTQETPRGTVSVVFIANPELDAGSPAPAGRVWVQHGSLKPGDLERIAEQAIGPGT